MCVGGEEVRHIMLNKLMSQCQFATERRSTPETSAEVGLTTCFTAELQLLGFLSQLEEKLEKDSHR